MTDRIVTTDELILQEEMQTLRKKLKEEERDFERLMSALVWVKVELKNGLDGIALANPVSLIQYIDVALEGDVEADDLERGCTDCWNGKRLPLPEDEQTGEVPYGVLTYCTSCEMVYRNNKKWASLEGARLEDVDPGVCFECEGKFVGKAIRFNGNDFCCIPCLIKYKKERGEPTGHQEEPPAEPPSKEGGPLERAEKCLKQSFDTRGNRKNLESVMHLRDAVYELLHYIKQERR
jgi:hypothetical protein